MMIEGKIPLREDLNAHIYTAVFKPFILWLNLYWARLVTGCLMHFQLGYDRLCWSGTG